MMIILREFNWLNEGFSGDSRDFSQTNPDIPPYNHGLKARFKWF